MHRIEHRKTPEPEMLMKNQKQWDLTRLIGGHSLRMDVSEIKLIVGNHVYRSVIAAVTIRSSRTFIHVLGSESICLSPT